MKKVSSFNMHLLVGVHRMGSCEIHLQLLPVMGAQGGGSWWGGA